MIPPPAAWDVGKSDAMDIPHQETLAPIPPVRTVTDEGSVLALFGSADNLERLTQFRRLEYLWISGVTMPVAQTLGRVPALRRLVVHDWRVADLQPLAGLGTLQELVIAGSSRLKSLEGLERLGNLRSLILVDSSNYEDLTPLAGLQRLETLCLEGGFSKQLRVATLGPVRSLQRLRRLRLASIRVGDRSLGALHSLSELRDVFIAKAFPPSEFQDLARALPEVRGEFVDSYRGGE